MTATVPPPTPDPRPWLLAPNWKEGHVHLLRAAQPKFGEGVAVDAERQVLASVGREAQDYMAWRRSMLHVSVVLLAVSALFAVVNFGIESNQLEQQRQQATGMDVDMLMGLTFLLVAAKVVLAVMAFLAWKRWTDLPSSHRRGKLGWVIGFVVPFLVFLVPVRWWLHGGGGLQPEQAMTLAGLEMVFGLMYFLMLLPSVLSLFIGAVRAALAVSRFMPESALPGWVASVAAPVFAMMLLAVFVLINQVSGNALLLIGFLCIFVNFMLYLRHGPRIARAHSRQEVEQSFGALRRQNYMLLGAGAALLLIALFTTKFLGRSLVGFGDDVMFSVWRFIEMVFEFAGKSTFTALLFADLLVAVVRHSRTANLVFPADLAAPLDRRLGELDQAGIGSLGALAEFRTSTAPARQTA
jgi:hypothetical protein